MMDEAISKNETELLSGIVGRVTFHNAENGWSVLRVSPINRPHDQVTVVIHQSKVFAGATMDFYGQWINHPKYGEQFKAGQAIEKKPASAMALEKYLGSGLIYGVGPKTAKKIVTHFGRDTLEVFENDINRLMEIQGIADEKLKKIKSCWKEHREIRNVMMFLQSYGISTIFAVKIYKTYGDRSIEVVKNNPFQLAKDIYGIGFFSADQVALKLGFKEDSDERIEAGIKHVLSNSREEGHCYLTRVQIGVGIHELLKPPQSLEEKVENSLKRMVENEEIKLRELKLYRKDKLDHHEAYWEKCFYSKTLFFDELNVSKRIKNLNEVGIQIDSQRVENWIEQYCTKFQVSLSEEQRESIVYIVQKSFSILTGGPGCGKTTTTKILVKLLLQMGKRIILAAPTGRASQRMSEVIGLEAKTIHRLLAWGPQLGGFKKNEENPLEGDFLIVDECSMLDISLTSSLLKAVPKNCQVLFIGDADQLPSVGAGNVLRDLIISGNVPCFQLTKIFRQAEESLIIRYAHEINKGLVPKIESPICSPKLWEEKKDCLFIDAEEATQEQAKLVAKARFVLKKIASEGGEGLVQKTDKRGREKFEKVEAGEGDDLFFYTVEGEDLLQGEGGGQGKFYRPDLVIPKKFEHVNLEQVLKSETEAEQLKSVMKKVHPWSTLNYGLTASEMIKKLYTDTLPKYFGNKTEIQILSPMIRGSLGTYKLNLNIQEAVNPYSEESPQIKLGEKIFRRGDRVIQRRNNYDLGVFNGDIGRITSIDSTEMQMMIEFGLKEDKKEVHYERENIPELDLAYAITIHKSQGSEFDLVIIPVMTQHFKMLYRNLIYTGLTRAKKLAVFVGTRKALTLAIKNFDARTRQTALQHLLKKK